jgi:DNA-binding response OmpR family regulator
VTGTGIDLDNRMPEKILVVEDEPSLQETLVYNLEKQGYQVESTGDGLAALNLARHLKPDLILLDIMLPGMDGFEVCKILRREMNVAILMLTARVDEADRIVGLEVGADDYLTKPFSMRELMARTKAQLRRSEVIREELEKIKTSEPAPNNVLTFGNLSINQLQREVFLDNQPLALKPKEYELLLCFAQHHGKMLSREFVLECVWGLGYAGDSRTVDVHISWLRQKIGDVAANPERIVTVRGGGYRFEG